MQFPPHAHFTPRHTIVEIPGYSQSNEPQAPNHPSARQAPQVWRAPEARLRRPWAAAGPGHATHRHPRPIGGRREACGAWPDNEPTRRAHISDHAPQVWRAPEGLAAAPVGGGRAWPGNTQTPPTDWRPPRSLRGLAGLRDDAPSDARGADGERAGRPRGGRRSVGATSSPAPRSTTRPWGASTTRQRVGHLAAPHPSTPIVQQAITLSPAPRRG